MWRKFAIMVLFQSFICLAAGSGEELSKLANYDSRMQLREKQIACLAINTVDDFDHETMLVAQPEGIRRFGRNTVTNSGGLMLEAGLTLYTGGLWAISEVLNPDSLHKEAGYHQQLFGLFFRPNLKQKMLKELYFTLLRADESQVLSVSLQQAVYVLFKEAMKPPAMSFFCKKGVYGREVWKLKDWPSVLKQLNANSIASLVQSDALTAQEGRLNVLAQEIFLLEAEINLLTFRKEIKDKASSTEKSTEKKRLYAYAEELKAKYSGLKGATTKELIKSLHLFKHIKEQELERLLLQWSETEGKILGESLLTQYQETVASYPTLEKVKAAKDEDAIYKRKQAKEQKQKDKEERQRERQMTASEKSDRILQAMKKAVAAEEAQLEANLARWHGSQSHKQESSRVE